MEFSKKSIKVRSKIEELDDRGFGMGSPEVNEISLVGDYFYSDELIKLNYTERGEQGEVKTEIFYEGGVVTVKRRGAIESEIRFAVGIEHSSVYSVAPYKFDMTVVPKRINAALSSGGGEIDLFYNMKIGGAGKAVRMRIWIQPS